MFTVKRFDGQSLQAEEKEGQVLLPYAQVLSHPMISEGAVAYYKGKVWPVKGPLPAKSQTTLAWLLFLHDHFQVINGLPRFESEAKENFFAPNLRVA